MSWDLNGTRSFTMTLAHRAVKDMRRDGFRQLRNYVDLCALLAHRPAQKRFFACAQEVLLKTDSLYYSLVHRLLDTVEEDILCTVGVNFGFDGLVQGIAKMKKQAETDGAPVSWLNVGQCGDVCLPDVVEAAEQRGSCIWLLHAPDGIGEAELALAKAHPCALFVFLASPEVYTADMAARLAQCHNTAELIVLQAPEVTLPANTAARILREQKLFYGFAVVLDETGAPLSTDPEWLDVAAQCSTLCLYARAPGMDAQTAAKLRADIVGVRRKPGVPLLLLDWEGDRAALDEALAPGAVLGNHLPPDHSFPLVLPDKHPATV